MASLTFYYGSGSPYAWRVWLALEHKGIPYEMKTLSFDAGDNKRPDFLAFNPRGLVPVIIDDGFVLYESAVIVEYLEDTRPQSPRLFAAEPRERALQRRLVREVDQYVAPAVMKFATLRRAAASGSSEEQIDGATTDLGKELARWERMVAGDYLAGAFSVADITLYPQVAIAQRVVTRLKGALPSFSSRDTLERMVLEMVEAVSESHPAVPSC